MHAWRDLEQAEPDIARAARRLLENANGRPEVAFLATVSAAGRPRMHPFVPAIVDGALYAFIMPSPKRQDLDRTGVYAIHSRLGRDDESFFVAGRASRVDHDTTRGAVAARMPYDDDIDDHGCYEFAIEHALWTTWTTPTEPVYRRFPDR